MAYKTSGSQTGNFCDYRETNMFNYGGKVTYSWELVEQSVLTNTSKIKWEIKLNFNNSNIIVHFAEALLYALEPYFDPYEEGNVNGYAEYVYELFHNDESIYSGANGLEQVIASGTQSLKHDIEGDGNFGLVPSFQYYHKDYYDGYDEEPTGGALNSYHHYAYFTVPPISRKVVIDAPNFNDEENPVVKLQIPADAQWVELCISFDGKTDAIPWRYIDERSTSYTFNFTPEERELLITTQLGEATKKVYFMAHVFYTYGYDGDFTDEYGDDYNTHEEYTTEERVLTVIGCMPTVSPIVEDINATTLALTGDKNTIVKYCSNAKYTINAAASKGATLTHQSASCAGVLYTDVPTGVFTGAQSGTFVFTASDSRDLIVSQVVEKKFIDYVKLTCNLETGLPKLEGYVPITISGNYFNGSFGKVNNTLELKYRYKINDGAFTAWKVVAATINSTNRTYTYSENVVIPNFNYKDSFVFEAAAADKLISKTITGNRVKTLPVFDWSAEDFNFNVPVTLNEKAEINYNEDTDTLSINSGSIEFKNAQIKIDSNGNLIANDLNLSGAAMALTHRYYLDSTVTTLGANYTDVEAELVLYGNMLQGFFHCYRKSNSSTGNITNELVCQIEFDSGNKIREIPNSVFQNGVTGGLANFTIQDTYIYPNDGSVSADMVGKGTMSIYLTATGTASNEFNTYFLIPVTVDLNKYR